MAISVSSAVKAKYLSDEFNGDYRIVIGGRTYTGRNVQQGSMEIVESLCSGDMFDLSAVEKGEINFTLINFTENIKNLQGKDLIADQIVAGEDVPLGVYTVVSAVNSGEYLVDVRAYDNMQLFDQDISDWWNNSVTFQITHRNLLIALCVHCNVFYDLPSSYCNSSLLIEKAFDAEGMTGLDMIGWLQEVAGCFFRTDRAGTLVARRIDLEQGMVPELDLYPADDLYPLGAKKNTGEGIEQIYNVPQIVSDLEVADYMTAVIDKLQIRGSADDIGVIVGTGTNVYQITSNPLLYALETADLETVATNIFNVIKHVYYQPFTARLKGLPYLETGDLVQVNTLKGLQIECPILKRTLSGTGLSYDLLECKGSEKRAQLTATNRSMKILNQRMHEVIVTVDEFRSTITELDETVGEHSTEIEQNANEINLQAKRSGIYNLLTNTLGN